MTFRQLEIYGRNARNERLPRRKYTSAQSGLGRGCKRSHYLDQVQEPYVQRPCEGLIFYQSTCPKFRYGDRKMLSTQSHSTHISTSSHYVQNPNPIKGSSNMLFYTLTHTHTHTFQTQHMPQSYCNHGIRSYHLSSNSCITSKGSKHHMTSTSTRLQHCYHCT